MVLKDMHGRLTIGLWVALGIGAASLVACSADPAGDPIGGQAGTGGIGGAGGQGGLARPDSSSDIGTDGGATGGGGGPVEAGAERDAAGERAAEAGPSDSGAAEGDVSEAGDAEGGRIESGIADAEGGDASDPTAALGSPWGVAPSASSTRSLASWAPIVAAAGVGWVRAFDHSQTDSSIAIAKANGLELTGFFFFSDPGPLPTFPVNNLTGWRDYVTGMVSKTRGQVRHWEVWNEPPNFSENKSPAAYATIVVNAYDAAKAADPTVQIGLAAQSNHVNWLAQTIDAGARDHFDYVTVHPYEILGLVEHGWEAEYMSIVPTLRKMLADKNPSKRDVPVWFTEVGEPVSGTITEGHQADTLVKAYVMGIAQGVARIHWFEPLDGDSGPFGLIDSNGVKRPSYTALSMLALHLGQKPRYAGWLLLNDAHYAFVFEGAAAPVMIAWALPGQRASVSLGVPSLVVEPRTGMSSTTDSYELTSSPVIFVGISATFVAQARTNAARPFPWSSDFSSATSVSYTAGAAELGLHPLGTRTIVTVDGGPALDVGASSGTSFTVDPNFSSYTTSPLRITAVVRRSGSDAAGFNLKYEATSGWKSTGSWYGVPGSDQWYTQTWTVTDAQFVGKWGYQFTFDSDSTQNSKYRIQSVTVAKP